MISFLQRQLLVDLITGLKTNLIISLETAKTQFTGVEREEFKKLSGATEINKQKNILISCFLTHF